MVLIVLMALEHRQMHRLNRRAPCRFDADTLTIAWTVAVGIGWNH